MDLLREETELPVQCADDPLTCVAKGTGRYLEVLDDLQRGHADLRKLKTLRS